MSWLKIYFLQCCFLYCRRASIIYHSEIPSYYLRSSEKVDEGTKKNKVETPPSSSNNKSEDLENESLSLLIPDVQTTSMLVHKAVDRYRWEHLKIDGSSTDGAAHNQGSGEELLSTEERYSSIMMPLQFGKNLGTTDSSTPFALN